MSSLSGLNHVLITGVAGFIGHHMGIRLLENDVHVYGVDNCNDTYDPSLKQRNLQLLRELAEESDPSFEFLELDLLDRPALSTELDEVEVDAVVHAAAETGPRYSLQHPTRCMQTNVQGTSNLIQEVADQDIDRFLFVSSSAVYGNHEEVPFSEDLADLEPVSPYGVSKRAAEMVCRSYQKHLNIHMGVVRLFPVYGPRQRPDMTVYALSRNLEKQEPLVVYGDGEVTRDFTYITDAIDGLCSALEQENDWGVYNVAGKETCRIGDLVEQLGRAFETEPEVQHQSIPDGEQTRVEADLEHARKDLDYEPTVAFDDGIERFVKWFQQRETGRSNVST